MTEPGSQMKKFKAQIQREVERDIADLERARDEIRLTIHLAGMDAKTSWRELEKKILLLRERATREGNQVADETWARARELQQMLKDFKSRV